MSEASRSDANQLMEQPNNDQSKVTGQFSVTTCHETSKPPKNLSDMPFDVVGLIIERSDYKEQLMLRKTSKALRKLVDKQEPACTHLKVSCKNDYIICRYNDDDVAYIQPRWYRTASQYEPPCLDAIISKNGFLQVAFDDLAFTLRNPKLQLEYFSFDSEKDCCNESDAGNSKNDTKFQRMQNILKSINHQLSVKACRIDVTRLSNAMSILPYLKPGVLEKITIFSEHVDDGWSDYSETIKQVLLLDQWKQAKELVLENGFYDNFLMKHCTHFKRFHFHESFVNIEMFVRLIRLRDYILEHESVEFCSISAFNLLEERFDDIMGTLVSPNTYHYTIPNSKYYLKLMVKDDLLTIEKKMKK